MNKTFVLLFHELKDPAWFEMVVRYLAKNYNVISADYLYNMIKDKRVEHKCCHITFDDGHDSFRSIAFPILSKYRMPSTVFVSPYILNTGDNYWFQKVKCFPHQTFHSYLCEQLKDEFAAHSLQSSGIFAILKTLPIDRILEIVDTFMVSQGVKCQESQNMKKEDMDEIVGSDLVELGSHTMHHPILSNEDSSHMSDEIVESLHALHDISGKPCRYFAYPNGVRGLDFSTREIEILKSNGVRLAFSTIPRSLALKDDMYQIPRIGLSQGKIRSIKLKLRYPLLWKVAKEQFRTGSEDRQRFVLYQTQNSV